MRREQILNGMLVFPQQIMSIINPNEEVNISSIVEEFWSNIWYNFLKEKPCDTITWFNKFDNPMLFNTVVMHLSKSGWITSKASNNYAFITLNESKLMKWITKEELINIKFKYKFLKYRLTKSKSSITDIVQCNGKHKQTGLVREGFMKAGNNAFKYDIKYITKYLPYICENVKKGLAGSTKDITYQEIIDELINYYSVDGTEYTLGNCLIDSRGRSIFQCSKKVFNPVSCKDARALLVCKAEQLDKEGWKVVYAAIAELLGYRGKNIEDKITYGHYMYILREVPSLEEMMFNENYEDLHILIWLERIYENIDNYEEKGWNVPIEVDKYLFTINFSNCWKLLRANGTRNSNNPTDWTISSQAA